jgi:hypothetical protein
MFHDEIKETPIGPIFHFFFSLQRWATVARHTPATLKMKLHKKWVYSGNTKWGGRLSTVDLFNVTCFVKKIK